jgi:hypothetical protein
VDTAQRRCARASELEKEAWWLTHDATATPLDEFAKRRVRRAAADFVKKKTLEI